MTLTQVAGKIVAASARAVPKQQFAWKPVRIGPAFEWLDHGRIRVLEGRLAERRFHISTSIHRESALVQLSEDEERIGEVSIERNPSGRGVVLWDAGVREDLRGGGLCSIMTWCIFRELLQVQRTASFRIRMVRSLKVGSKATGVQNIGMVVMAARLGFSSELDLVRLLTGENITGIEIIDAHDGTPPALKINLRVDPLSLIAFALSPDTLRPTANLRTYLELKSNDWLIHQWADQGLISVSGDYCLRKPNVDHFVNRLAVDADEAIRFRHMIRGF